MERLANPCQSDTADICVICLSVVAERAITSCNHSAFDFLCLVSWLQTRSTCPLCKAEVSAVTYQHTSPSDFKTYHVRRTHAVSTPSQDSNTSVHISRSFPRRRRRRTYSPPRTDTALLRRRYIYKHNLYSLHVGSNTYSGYRNITPQLFSSSPDLQSRARTWIRRELRVFRFLYDDTDDTSTSASTTPTTSNNAEFLLTYIVSMLRTLDIRDSDGRAEDLLQEFLGRQCARLFLHELNAWLRSPYQKVEEWDVNVQYKEMLPTDFDEEGRPVWSFGKEEGNDSAESSRMRRMHRRGAIERARFDEPG